MYFFQNMKIAVFLILFLIQIKLIEKSFLLNQKCQAVECYLNYQVLLIVFIKNRETAPKSLPVNLFNNIILTQNKQLEPKSRGANLITQNDNFAFMQFKEPIMKGSKINFIRRLMDKNYVTHWKHALMNSIYLKGILMV